MRILITGANGFLGSNVLRALLKNGHDIFAISQNDEAIKDLFDKIQFYKNKEDNYFNLKQDILKFDPHVVLHFAWWGGNNYIDTNSTDQFNKNIPLTLSLLEIFKETKSKNRFIGVGSFSEYGIISNKATEDTPENPNSYYGLSKNIVKNISKMFCENNSISWSWIRPCYIYGPGDVKTRLMPSIISKLKNQTVIELNSCTTIVDYLHIDDFSEAINLLIQKQANGVYNICSGQEYTIKNIVTSIANEFDKENQLIFNAKLDRIDFPKYICGSNNKLVNTIDWTPSIDIKNGISNMIKKEI